MMMRRSVGLIAGGLLLAMSGCSNGDGGSDSGAPASHAAPTTRPAGGTLPSGPASTEPAPTTTAPAAPPSVWGERLPSAENFAYVCDHVEAAAAGSALTAHLDGWWAAGDGSISLRCALGVEGDGGRETGWELEAATGGLRTVESSSWRMLTSPGAPMQVQISELMLAYPGLPYGWTATPLAEAVLAATSPKVRLDPTSRPGRLCRDLIAAAGLTDGVVAWVRPLAGDGVQVQCESPTGTPRPAVQWGGNTGSDVTVTIGATVLTYTDTDARSHPPTDLVAAEAAVRAALE